MAQPNDSLTVNDLFSIKSGGFVREEVYGEIQRLQKLLRIETLLLDRIGRGTVRNHEFSWLSDDLDAPEDADTDFGTVAEASEYPLTTSASGLRYKNFTQYHTKGINISDRNLKVDVYGRSDEMAYQTMKRIRELERDMETQIADGNNASVRDNGNNVKGRTAPLAVQIGAHTADNVVANGSTGGGYDEDTGLFTAITPGTGGAVALDFDDVRELVEAIYLAGGNASLLTSHPSVIKKLNEWLLGPGSAYRFAPVQAHGSATETQDLAASGWFTVVKTDFGTRIELVPNRSQKGYMMADDQTPERAAHVYLLDTQTVDVVFIDAIEVEPLAKTGLYTRKGVKVDYGLRVNDPESNGVIRNVSLTADVLPAPA